MDLSQAEDDYRHIGFANRVGFGATPALLIIDSKYGDVLDIDAVIEEFRRLPQA